VCSEALGRSKVGAENDHDLADLVDCREASDWGILEADMNLSINEQGPLYG
jgi:hypothetical protein